VNLTNAQDIPLTQDLTIDGGSGVTIDANSRSRIFFITGGTITLKNLTLANGSASGGAGGAGTSGGGGAAGMGGAIFVNAGSLAINGVTFTNNQATGGEGGPVISSLFLGGGGGTGGVGGSTSAGINGNGAGGGDFGSHGGGGAGGSQPGAGDGAGGGNGSDGAFGGGGSGTGGAGGNGGFGAGAGGAQSFPGSSGTFAGTGGPPVPNGGGFGGAGLGGAIFMRNGTLSLANATFSSNSANGGLSQSGGSNGQGKGGALYISSSATAASTDALPTFSNNSAVDAGSGTACNTVTGATALDTNDICGVLVGPVTHFSVTAPPVVTSWVAYQVTVRALDDNDNVVTSYNGTVHLTSTDPGLANPTGDSTLTNGQLAFGVAMKVAGTQTITATDTVNSSITGTSSAILVNPGAPAHLTITAPSTIVGGTSFPFTVTVTDLFGNLPTNYSGTLHFTSSDAAAVLPADFAMTGATGSFNATLKTPGNQTMTVSDSALTGNSSDIAVTIPEITVTTTADSGVGSLRVALAVAAADGSGNIIFDPGVFGTAQTINSASTLNIPSNTSITGPAAGVTVAGGGSSSNFSVFNVALGVTNASITGMTIANGYIDSQGGGIVNAGALTVTRCTFLNNYAGGYITPAGNGGGAIYANAGTLAIVDSTFSGNTSAPGGAITANSGTLTISGSTFTGNSALAGKAGGGIFINSATVTISNSTFSGNSATGGGAVFNYGTVTVANSILSANTGGDCDAAGGTTCATNGADGNVVGVTNVSLAPLGNYGGPTQTMIPLPGSPAICAGINSSLPAADQRGLARTTTYGPTTCVDSGAVQTNYSLAFTAEPPATITTGAPFATSVTLSESGTVFQPAVSIPLNVTGGASFSPVTTSNGVASFAGLTVNLAGGPNTLTAALPLTPAISVSAVSNPFTSILATTVTSLQVSTTTTTATLFATVTGAGGTPTGTVQFMRGPTILGTATLVGGTAGWTGSPAAGLVTAVYSGSASYSASTSAPQNIVYVTKHEPGPMTITSSANPSVFGEPVTFTVSFASPIPTTGSVQFSAGPTFLGAVGLSGSSDIAFTTAALPLGSDSIAVVYNGDSNYSSTQGSIIQVVNQAATVTTQSLSMAGSGQATLIAAVNAATPATGTPAGTIQFQDLSNNNAVAATAILSNGTASANLRADLAAHPIVAVYSGDEDFITSTSAPLPTVVSSVGVLTATYAPDQIVSLYAVPGLSGDKAGTPPYTDTLLGVTVTITDSTGTPRKALLYGVFESAGQINLVIPSETAAGTAQVTTRLADGTTVQSLVNISNVSPGIFTANQNGQGVFVGSIIDVGPYGQRVSESTVFDASQNLWVAQPFHVSPNQAYLVLYGTGIRHAASVTATVGGVNVPVAYSGVQPTYPGMDQINLGPLPQSLAGAGNVDIVVTADGHPANTVTTAIQ
jgi:hypothetical protein